MAGPMIFGIAALKSVSMIDTLYVGQIGADQLAALSFAFPVTTVILGLTLGLSAGASSVVSRALGEGADDRARQLSLNTLILMILMTVSVGGLGALVTKPLFSLLGASDTTLPYITAYMQIWLLGVPFLGVAMICDFIMRATGNSLWPSLIMTSGSIFNIAITGVLIFGFWGLPKFGIEGAALGTLIAQALMASVMLWLITAKVGLVKLSLPKLSEMIPCWLAAARVAGPAAIGNMVHPFVLTIVTAMLAAFSEKIVAAFGVATQVQMLVTIPLLALSAALSPIAGQNWGAGKPDRINKALRESYWLCVVWALLVAIPLWFFGAEIASLFSDDEKIPGEAAVYLRIVPFSLFGYGMVICAAAAFNAIDEAKRALGFNVIRSLILFLPLTWFGSMLFDAKGVYGGIAAGNVIAGVLTGWYALFWLRRHSDRVKATA
jgi:putative MATE family efflux protein